MASRTFMFRITHTTSLIFRTNLPSQTNWVAIKHYSPCWSVFQYCNELLEIISFIRKKELVWKHCLTVQLLCLCWRSTSLWKWELFNSGDRKQNWEKGRDSLTQSLSSSHLIKLLPLFSSATLGTSLLICALGDTQDSNYSILLLDPKVLCPFAVKKKVFILTQNPLVLYYAMWFKNRSKFPFNMWNQLSPCGNVTELQLSWCIMEEQRQSKLLWSIKEEEENNKGKLAHSKSNSQSLVSGSRGMLWEEVASQGLAGQTHMDFLPSRFGCLLLPSTGWNRILPGSTLQFLCITLSGAA